MLIGPAQLQCSQLSLAARFCPMRPPLAAAAPPSFPGKGFARLAPPALSPNQWEAGCSRAEHWERRRDREYAVVLTTGYIVRSVMVSGGCSVDPTRRPRVFPRPRCSPAVFLARFLALMHYFFLGAVCRKGRGESIAAGCLPGLC